MSKTSITLTAINNLLFDYFKVSKVLVIAPLRVASNTWPDELRKWDHLQELKYSLVLGSRKQREEALLKRADIYIINRENVQWLIESSGIPFKFDMVVIYELSSFKDSSTKRFRSLLKVRPKIIRIVGLTGTPASNGLIDLWAQFKLLDNGKRLGLYKTHFLNRYFIPDKRNAHVIYSYKALPGSEEEIYNNLSDITISMKSGDYLEMPELITNEVRVNLDEKEYKNYTQLKKEFVLDLSDGQVTAANAAVLTNKLCQLANGAIYTDERDVLFVHDRKLDALEDIIESANNKPLLVAYWFKHDLERIKKRLSSLKINYKLLTGEDSIKEWNKGLIKVALIHPASAGHGLNLQSGGSTLVWFSIPWSLELYQQTIARIYRQGQRSSTVVVQHIITANTIDEAILKALNKKDLQQEELITAVKANLSEVLLIDCKRISKSS